MSGGERPVGVGLIGAGWMGSFHAETLARRLTGARLVAVADPMPGAAATLVERLGTGIALTEPEALLAAPGVEAVVIASPARTHAAMVVAAAEAGLAIFCEKPMAVTLAEADRAIAAAATRGVPLQVGFNRRFDRGFGAAHEAVVAGAVGTPRLLRSLTRDPGPWTGDPGRVPPGTIFLETLIHDFDALRYLNPGARATEVYAIADALVRPDWRDRGFFDTAMVTVRFDNGAMASAEANFSALYGYDVRGEVFGSAGMVTAGDVRTTSMTAYGSSGISVATVRLNIELFHDAYVAELAEFVACVRSGTTPSVTGEDARAALAIALAAIRSVETGAPVKLAELDPGSHG